MKIVTWVIVLGSLSIQKKCDTQETCLYRRLNAVLHDFDKFNLEPFLPFMKLLLSGLYKLSLKQVRTYRGVKRQLYELSRLWLTIFKCHLSTLLHDLH